MIVSAMEKQNFGNINTDEYKETTAKIISSLNQDLNESEIWKIFVNCLYNDLI
jgi:hypothetical protein